MKRAIIINTNGILDVLNLTRTSFARSSKTPVHHVPLHI